MIEIHFHCLPGLDDGPRNWTEAVDLCRASHAEGTEIIVATPHVLRDRWVNEDPAVRSALVTELNERLDGTPRIVDGCELFFSADILELWERGALGPVTSINGGRYVLIEFPAMSVPKTAESLIHELSILGVVPVIAHPERNREFAQDADRLERLVALGAITQLTAGSLVGDFGEKAAAAAETFMRRRLAHCIASDAHDVVRRPPRMRRAFDFVAKMFGEETASQMFVSNPRRVVFNEALGRDDSGVDRLGASAL